MASIEQLSDSTSFRRALRNSVPGTKRVLPYLKVRACWQCSSLERTQYVLSFEMSAVIIGGPGTCEQYP